MGYKLYWFLQTLFKNESNYKMKKLFIPLILLLILFSCKTEKNEFSAIDLRCEYLENPTGLEMQQPRLFWKMDKLSSGARQTAYQVQVATSIGFLKKDSADLWDSGIVKSDESIQIEYKGNPLQTGMSAYWRVRIWDENNEVSPWSETARWEMALMKPQDWQANWIGAPAEITSGELKYASPFFRKSIKLSGKIKNFGPYRT